MVKIKVLGCSVCKTPYDYSKVGINYDYSKDHALIPLCENDAKHEKGYDDELIEIEV